MQLQPQSSPTPFRQTRHCIDEITVELEFGNKTLEQRECANVARWLSEELLPALDDLFSFYAPGEQTIRFEQLVFDFGNLPASDYRQIISEQLIQKITRLIQEKRLPLDVDASLMPGEKSLVESSSALKVLLEFLRSGNLSVQSFRRGENGKSQKVHQLLLDSLITEENIAAHLRKLPNPEKWIERLLKQFSERHRVALLRQLAPLQVEPAIALLDVLQAEPMTVSATALTKTWHVLFEIALEYPQAEDQRWFNQLLTKWMQQVPETTTEFIHYLHQQGKVKNTTENNPESHALTLMQALAAKVGRENNEWITTIATLESNRPAQQVDNDIAVNGQLRSPADIQSLLTHIFNHGDITAFVNFWHGWRQQYKNILIVELKRHLVKKEFRQHLFTELPVNIATELLELVAPDIKTLLAGFNSDVAFYLKAANKIQKSSSVPLSSVPPSSIRFLPNEKTGLTKKQTSLSREQASLPKDETGLPKEKTSLLKEATVNITNDKWLRDIYQIVARELFVRVSTQGDNLQKTPSLDVLLEAVAKAYAQQENLPVHELHTQWKNIYTKYDPVANGFSAYGNDKKSNPADAQESVKQQLARIFIRGDATALTLHWDEWQSHHKELLISGLRHYLVKAELRQQLLLKLTTDFIHQLLTLVAPVAKPVLENFKHNIEAYMEYLNNAQQVADITTNQIGYDELLRRFYEITATLVFGSSVGDNNEVITIPIKDKLLDLVISQLAEQYNLPEQELNSRWQPLFELTADKTPDTYPKDNIQVVEGSVSTPQNILNEQELLARVQQAFSQTSLSATGIESIWPQIRNTRSAGIVAAVIAVWEKEAVRQQLVTVLPISLLEEIFGLIAPHYHQWVAQLSKQSLPLLQTAINLHAKTGSHSLTGVTRDQWLRELYRTTANILWAVPTDNTLTTFLKTSGLPKSGLPEKELQKGELQKSKLQKAALPKSELLKALTRHFANKYMLPEMPLLVRWADILNSTSFSKEEEKTFTINSQDHITLESTENNQLQQIDSRYNKKIAHAKPGIQKKEIAKTSNNIAQSIQVTSQLLESSAQELFDVCMDLKQNNALRNRLPNNEQIIARMIDSFVKYSPNFSAEFRTCFLSAIHQTLSNVHAKAEFLRKVLFSLIDDQLIDLDAIALSVNPVNVSKVNAIAGESQKVHSDTFDRIHLEKQQESNASQQPAQDSEQQTRQRLSQLMQELRNGNINPFSLRMSLHYWQRLVGQILHAVTSSKNYSIVFASIRKHSLEAIDPNYFYQQVTHALVMDLPLDMEIFITRAREDHPENLASAPKKDAVGHQEDKNAVAKSGVQNKPGRFEKEISTLPGNTPADENPDQLTKELLNQLNTPVDHQGSVIKSRNFLDNKNTINDLVSNSNADENRKLIDSHSLTAISSKSNNQVSTMDHMDQLNKDSSINRDIQMDNEDSTVKKSDYSSPQNEVKKEEFIADLNGSLSKKLADQKHTKLFSPQDNDLLHRTGQLENNLSSMLETQSNNKDSSIQGSSPLASETEATKEQLTVDYKTNSNPQLSDQSNLKSSSPKQSDADHNAVSSEVTSPARTGVNSGYEEPVSNDVGNSNYRNETTRNSALVSSNEKIADKQQANQQDLQAVKSESSAHPQNIDGIESQLSELVDVKAAYDNRYQNSKNATLDKTITNQLPIADQDTATKEQLARQQDLKATLSKIPDLLNRLDKITKNPLSIEPARDKDSGQTMSENTLHTPELSLEQLLQENASLSSEQLQQLQQYINILLQHYTQAQAQEWNRILRNPLCSQHLIRQVPGHLLHQIAQRLQAAAYTALDPVVKLALEALSLLMPAADPLVIKQARWEFIFARLFSATDSLDAAELLQRCCEQLALATGFDDSPRLVQLAERRLALLKPVANARPAMSLADNNPTDEPALNFEAGLHLNNVGMVLASPFLPRLFSMFNLLEDGKFIHSGAADRAVHLLQYMVTGQSETPEYELILNKILCGISTSMPVSEGIVVTEQEKTIIDQMLQSMIQHWRALGATSVAGLRETFFLRQGWLVLDEEYWRLKVQERTFDMLLDRLPWSISLIKHAWMDKPLRVSWREQS